MKKDRRGINPASKPSGDGCVECLASAEGWWFHLRRCAQCGHIGCCDSSPRQHASKHAAAAEHPIIASFEPGEDWFFDYEKGGWSRVWSWLPPHSATLTINRCLSREGEFQPSEESLLHWLASIITFTDGPVYTVSIMEFRDGKVAHETQYFAEPFEAPAWRAQWVERTRW